MFINIIREIREDRHFQFAQHIVGIGDRDGQRAFFAGTRRNRAIGNRVVRYGLLKDGLPRGLVDQLQYVP